MQRVLVEETLDAPIERVFAVLTDHENYDRFRDVAESRLLQHGHTDKNGVGAVCQIQGTSLRSVLVEEIPLYEPPTRFEYRVVRSTPFSLDHRKGVVELTAVGDKTRVRWEPVFHIKVPVLGVLLDKVAGQAATKAFRRVLAP